MGSTRHCDGCGRDVPEHHMRPLKQGCARVPDKDVCADCEARWVAQGFLHKDRLEGRAR